MTARLRRTAPTFALLCLVLLGRAGCGDDDEEEEEAGGDVAAFCDGYIAMVRPPTQARS